MTGTAVGETAGLEAQARALAEGETSSAELVSACLEPDRRDAGHPERVPLRARRGREAGSGGVRPPHRGGRARAAPGRAGRDQGRHGHRGRGDRGSAAPAPSSRSPRTRKSCAGSVGRAPWSSARRPRPRSGSGRSARGLASGSPAIRGISATRPAARAAAPRRPSRPGWSQGRSAPTERARCAFPRPGATSSASSPSVGASRPGPTPRRSEG